jgi:transposase-like protein
MKNKPAVVHEMDLMELMLQFGSDDKCRQYLEDLRFPDGVYCTRCSSNKISRIIKRNQFMCDTCKYQFSAMAGTIFHDTHLPLVKWFAAVYLMCESRKGVSANQLKRTLKVSYKTAWYLCHRIREAVKTDTSAKLSGTIEVDETFIGGIVGNMHKADREKRQTKRGTGGKIVAIGALEREGDIRLRKIDSLDRETLHAFIRANLDRDAIRVVTDERQGYHGIDQTGVKHETVNHRKEEYVRGDIHTNGIENVWSLLKRSIMGSFHHVSEKHLDRYLDELEFRFNNRENPYLFRDTLIRLLNSDNLEYKELVKN